MKRIVMFVVALAVVVGLSAPIPAQGQDESPSLLGGEFEWDISIDVGQLYFREDFHLQYLDEDPALPIVLGTDDVHEEFDTFMTRVDFTAGDYDFDGLEAGLNFSILGTANQDDLSVSIYTPYVDGAPDVPNITETESNGSIDVHGFTIMPEAGVGGELAEGLRGALLLGYGYRRTELERAPDLDTVYDVHYLNFKASLEMDVPNVDGLTLVLEPEIAPVIGSKRTDDISGNDFTIRGESGVMFSLCGQARYDVKDNIRLVLGVFYDFQQLDGGCDNDPELGAQIGPVGCDNVKLEWDDSLLQTVGATLGVEFLF